MIVIKLTSCDLCPLKTFDNLDDYCCSGSYETIMCNDYTLPDKCPLIGKGAIITTEDYYAV